ncbi:hypothetical protein [Pseudogemmobacter sonorensis]|uniref:hypothetical protein n=1 Tax=Pseudogemmobacter sonorensis TaxID=2989681 RepID=UPI0036A2E330
MAGEDQWWLNDPIVGPATASEDRWWEKDEVISPAPGADAVTAEPAAQSAAMTDGLARLSDMTVNPPPPARGIGQVLYDNVIGDPDDGVQSYGESLGTWLNRAGESATLGIVGDEANAAAYSMLPGRTYEGELGRFRANEDNMSTMGRLSADLAGGLIPAAAGVGVAAKAPSLAGVAGRGALMGVGAGATQGFMEGEGGVADRAGSGAIGAGAGAILGGAIPVAGHAAGKAVRSVKESFGNSRMAIEIAKKYGIKPETARALSETLGVDDPTAIRSYLDDAGPHAMMADASPAAAGALDVAMQSPGRAARVAHDRITGRATEAARDLTGALDDSLGRPGAARGAEIVPYNPEFAAKQAGVPREADGWVKLGPRGLSDSIRSGTAKARDSAYKRAYAAPIDYASEAGLRIEDLLKRVPDSAIRRANELMSIEGLQSAQIMAQIGDDGAVTFMRMPDVRQLDYITRALNDVAAAADGQGKLGGTTALGRAIGGLSKDLRGAVKEAVPEYGKALDIASDAISEKNALDLGMKIFSPSTTREEIFDAVKDASQAEIAAMKRGARSFIDEKLANVRAVISDHSIEPRQAMEALRQLGSPASQSKMKALLGDGWQPLKDSITKAYRALELRSRTARNSATFARGVANEALDEAISPSLMRQGKPVAWAKDAIATALGASKTAVKRTSADAKAELADLLTRQGAGSDLLAAMESARSGHSVGPEAGIMTNRAVSAILGAMLPRGAEDVGQGALNFVQGR